MATQSVRLTLVRLIPSSRKATAEMGGCGGVERNSPGTDGEHLRLSIPVSTTEPTDHPTDRPADAGVGAGAGASDPAEITVYWRPGCPFCGSLFRQLDRAELTYRRVNIWDDEVGAAVVRSIARGNETVPTVVVGEVGMVNPSIAQVLTAAGRS